MIPRCESILTALLLSWQKPTICRHFRFRISLAEVLLKEFRDASQAAGELAACESELAANADESVIREWSGLMKQCGREMEHQCPGLANPNNLGEKRG